MPVERSTVSAIVAAASPSGPGPDVDELVLADPVVDDGQAAGGHEAAGGRGRQTELVGTALGRESPLDHGEGALGPRRPGRLGQRAGAPGGGGPGSG